MIIIASRPSDPDIPDSPPELAKLIRDKFLTAKNIDSLMALANAPDYEALVASPFFRDHVSKMMKIDASQPVLRREDVHAAALIEQRREERNRMENEAKQRTIDERRAIVFGSQIAQTRQEVAAVVEAGTES